MSKLTTSVVNRGRITEVTVNLPKIAAGARDTIEGEIAVHWRPAAR